LKKTRNAKKLKAPELLSCRRKMTAIDIIQKILAESPQVTQEQVLEMLRDERTRSGGLLGDETLLRLIAAKYGVEVQQNGISNSGTLATSCLFAGLNDVSVAGRLIAIYPVRTYEGEKSGKYAALMIADNEGTLRVMLWNEQANLVERGELKIGQTLRLLHGYTRADRYGKVELHLGGRSRIEVDSPEKTSPFPIAEKFTTKIGSLTSASGTVHISGVVKAISGTTNFPRNDEVEGKVMRITLADDSGQVTGVVWNEKTDELKTLKANSRLVLINDRVKETQNGGFEVHVDSNTCVNFQAAELQLTKMASLTENQTVNVQGVVASFPQTREVTTGKGEKVKLTVFNLKDDSGTAQVSAWRQHSDTFEALKIGDEVTLENVYAKKGFEGKMELSTRSGTEASIKPT
jgi:ssDNA-binding replication factor A large subunit